MKRKMSDHEARPQTIGAYGPTCIGCQDHEADVMVSWTVRPSYLPVDERDGPGGLPWGDLFLTWEQAERLRDDLNRLLSEKPK